MSYDYEPGTEPKPRRPLSTRKLIDRSRVRALKALGDAKTAREAIALLDTIELGDRLQAATSK